MISKIITSLTVLLSVACSAAEYHTISSFQQIQIDQSFESVIYLDLDETVMESSLQLGSKKWRDHIRKTAESEHDALSWFVAQHVPVIPTEPELPSLIQQWQTTHKVFGLTARERNIWYYTPQEGVDLLTLIQLNSIDLQFSPSNDPAPEFYEGIYFCHLETKGEYILYLLANSQPNHVIFVDDKLSQVESVAEALEQLGIPHDCYLYKPESKEFNPQIAEIQLLYLRESGILLSDDQAALETGLK